MELLKHRPRISILVSSANRVGEELVVDVLVEAKCRIRVGGLSARWVSEEVAKFGSGQSTMRERFRSNQGVVEIMSATVLEPGVHTKQLSIRIPKNASPSYSGRNCATIHMLLVRLRIPWWLDRRAQFELPIKLSQGGPHPSGKPRLFSSSRGGLQAKNAYFEGSVATDVLVAGDALRGAVALLNTEHNRYLRLAISLVAIETLHAGGRRADLEVRRISLSVDTRRPAEGESYEFAVSLPKDLAPSMSAKLWSLRWSLEVVAQIRLGLDESLVVPLVVLPSYLRSEKALQLEAPSVGSVRERQLWAGTAAALGFEYSGGVMRAELEDAGVNLKISRQHRGRDGWRLVASLRFSSLRIGARIEASSILRGTAFGGLAISGGRWQKDHHVSARCSEQVSAFFSELASALSVFPSVEMDDEHMELERSDSGLRRKRLQAFVTDAKKAAMALSRARTLLLPPAEFESSMDGWREFAAGLGAELEPGGMFIDGNYRGLGVRIGHNWRGPTLHETWVEFVGLARQVEGESIVLRGSGAQGDIVESDIEGLQEEAREGLREALLGARGYASLETSERLVLPPQVAPGSLRARLAALAPRASSRASGVGPYR